MTDRELLYVVTIAEERNVTHAAERLHLAQPSLTQCIQRIEAELGCPLFVRRKYGLDPTEAGELYISMAKDILARKEQFEKDLQLLQSSQAGQISLGASWYNTLLFLSDAIPEINTLFPGVFLSLTEKGTNALMDLFANHELDLMLSHEYPQELTHAKRSWAKDVACERLIDERFVLVAHKRFAISSLEEANETAISALSEMPFISFNETQRIRRITDAAFEAAGICTRKVVTTQSFPGALDLAERGIGLAVLPAFYAKRNLRSRPDLECYSLPASWNIYWSTCVYYRVGEHRSAQIQGILTILQGISERLTENLPDCM